jgi:DNA processing protein
VDAATASALQLTRVPGLGPVSLTGLYRHFGSFEAVLAARGSALRAAGLSEALCRAVQAATPDLIRPDREWLDAAPQRTVLLIDDAAYPARLRDLSGAPPVLFVQGDPDWLAMPQLAIVGSRSATPQGLENARAFADHLVQRGLTITSGLAVGVDAAAHQGALEAGGGTVAVCATGLDRVYPARHRALARQIAAEGALVSEFPIGTAPQAGFFPRRNRLISALSLGVLVVEAARESGSLITARLAIEQGREVFAMPGSIHNPQARGCHALIRQGAKLVESADDILEELAPLIGTGVRRMPAANAPENPDDPHAGSGDLTPEGTAVLAAIGDAAQDFDALLAQLRLGVSELSAQLITLELAGHVQQGADGRYRVVRRG